MKTLFFLIAIALPFASAQAQTTAVSGSQAVVCYDSNKQIQSAELFDLFEGRSLYGRTLQTWPAGTNFLDIASEVAKRLDQGRYGAITIQEFNKRKAVIRDLDIAFAKHNVESWSKYNSWDKMIAAGASFKKTRDAQTLLLPTNCKIKQLSVSDDRSEETYIVSDIWHRLDEVSKAAYVIRTSIYRVFRVAGETDSQHARRVVALAFSNFDFQSPIADVPEKFLFCGSSESKPLFKMIAFENPKGDTILQFLTFGGKDLATKSTMTVDKQSGPFADPKEFVGGWSGLPFEQESDLQIKSNFDLKSIGKKRLEFRIGERRDLHDGDEKTSLLRCVPGTFYKD